MKITHGRIFYTEIEKNIMMGIGCILDEYFKRDDRTELDRCQMISEIGITGVKYEKHLFKKAEVLVYCSRPGLLIGSKGCIINYITQMLSSVGVIKGTSFIVMPVENDVQSHIFSYASIYDI